MNVSRPQIRGSFVLPGMKKKEEHPYSIPRLPFLNWLPHGTRNHFVAMCGEFTGTFLFLFFAFSGTQVANTADPNAIATSGADTSRLLYISLAFGFSLGVNAWVFFRISGGLFNPAVGCPLNITSFALIAKQVTLGMCLVGAVPWIRGSLIFIAQLIGGIAAAGVVDVLFPGGLLIRTTLDGGTSVTQGLFIEMFLTAQLVFTIFMLAAEKHKATFIAPIGIGLSLFIAELSGVFFTGGSLNPVRSFGPCVILHTFEEYHWIYWAGPALGSIVAAGFYKFIKTLEYETANPGQDFDDVEAPASNRGNNRPQPLPAAPETRASDPTDISGRGDAGYADRARGLHGYPLGRPAYNTSRGTTYPVRSGPVPHTPPSKPAAGALSVAKDYPTGEDDTNHTLKADPLGDRGDGLAIESGTYAAGSTARPC